MNSIPHDHPGAVTYKNEMDILSHVSTWLLKLTPTRVSLLFSSYLVYHLL